MSFMGRASALPVFCTKSSPIGDDLVQKQSYLENPEIWANFVSNLYKTDWVAFVKETFNGHGNAIRYLGRYMFRTAISNSRILEVDYDKETVTFKYKDHKDDDTWKVSTISAYEFIGRYLSHVLPKGVHRATYGGMLVNRKKEFFKRRVCQARNKMYLASYFKGRRKMADVMKYLYHRDIDICPHCGCKLIHFNWRDKRLRDFADLLGWRSLTTPPVIGDYQCQTAELGVMIFLKLFRSLRPEDFSQVFPDLCGDGFASDSRDTEELA